MNADSDLAKARQLLGRYPRQETVSAVAAALAEARLSEARHCMELIEDENTDCYIAIRARIAELAKG